MRYCRKCDEEAKYWLKAIFPPNSKPSLPSPTPTPPEVQEAFQFLLATAMHEVGKFELVSVAEVDDGWHYTRCG